MKNKYPRIVEFKRRPQPETDGINDLGKPCVVCGTNTLGIQFLQVSYSEWLINGPIGPFFGETSILWKIASFAGDAYISNPMILKQKVVGRVGFEPTTKRLKVYTPMAYLCGFGSDSSKMN